MSSIKFAFETTPRTRDMAWQDSCPYNRCKAVLWTGYESGRSEAVVVVGENVGPRNFAELLIKKKKKRADWFPCFLPFTQLAGVSRMG